MGCFEYDLDDGFDNKVYEQWFKVMVDLGSCGDG